MIVKVIQSLKLVAMNRTNKWKRFKDFNGKEAQYGIIKLKNIPLGGLKGYSVVQIIGIQIQLSNHRTTFLFTVHLWP